MLIMVCYFKKICGINQAEDRVTWPDLLHRRMSALASFREWSVNFPRGSKFGPNLEIPAGPAIQLRPRPDYQVEAQLKCPGAG